MQSQILIGSYCSSSPSPCFPTGSVVLWTLPVKLQWSWHPVVPLTSSSHSEDSDFPKHIPWALSTNRKWHSHGLWRMGCGEKWIRCCQMSMSKSLKVKKIQNYETAEISRTSVMEFLFRQTLNTWKRRAAKKSWFIVNNWTFIKYC